MSEKWRPLRLKFCKLLDFPEHYSWEAIHEEVELMKRRLSRLDLPELTDAERAALDQFPDDAVSHWRNGEKWNFGLKRWVPCHAIRLEGHHE